MIYIYIETILSFFPTRVLSAYVPCNRLALIIMRRGAHEYSLLSLSFKNIELLHFCNLQVHAVGATVVEMQVPHC